MSEITEEEIARDIPSALATQIMALDWKARKDWTVDEQAWRYGELQEMIDAILQPALERARREERERCAKIAEGEVVGMSCFVSKQDWSEQKGLRIAAAIRKG